MSRTEPPYSDLNPTKQIKDEFIYNLRTRKITRRRTPYRKRRFGTDMSEILKEIQQRSNDKSQKK